MPGRTSPRTRRKGISPWVPNQHGAWAMLITPAVAGVLAAAHHIVHAGTSAWAWLTLLAVLVAWFFGYFTFFAFGLVAKARTPQRRKDYITPVYAYGAVALLGIAVALISQPTLLWWALFFVPLVAIACHETARGRPRSTLSGVSTTVASALLLPALVTVGLRIPPAELSAAAWAAGTIVALFFSGSVTYVKSMIRERKNPRYLHGSIVYHGAALLATIILVAALRPGWVSGSLLVVGMMWATVRSWYYPRLQSRGHSFSPKQVGLRENPPLLLVSFGALIACL